MYNYNVGHCVGHALCITCRYAFYPTENSTVSSISHQDQVIIPTTESILVAVIVLLAASMTIVSLSFAFYCCYAHQQLGKAKTYSVNSPNNIEKYNVKPYLTAAGQSCAAIDPVIQILSKNR